MPFTAKRGDEADQDDQPGVDHQPRDFSHPADVLDAIGVAETKIAVQAMPHVVAVQNHGALAQGVKPLLDQICHGRFTRARQTGEPEDTGLLAVEGGPSGLVDGHCMPMEVRTWPCQPSGPVVT